jgi:hypothetical protein
MKKMNKTQIKDRIARNQKIYILLRNLPEKKFQIVKVKTSLKDWKKITGKNIELIDYNKFFAEWFEKNRTPRSDTLNWIIDYDETDHFDFFCPKCFRPARVYLISFDIVEGMPTIYFHLLCEKCGHTGVRKIYINYHKDLRAFLGYQKICQLMTKKYGDKWWERIKEIFPDYEK